MKITKITLEQDCPSCGKKQVREIPYKRYKKLLKGKDYIQDVFPDSKGYDGDFREFFLSGICSECWAEMMEIGGEIGDLEDALG